MKEDSHRFQRLLSLLKSIRESPGQSAQELAEHFETSKRNLFRDIRLLQESGFAIKNENGYSLPHSEKDWHTGLNPWEQPGAQPVPVSIRVEAALAKQLLEHPLHPSQKLKGDSLKLEANPDRVMDWLMAVQGAELLKPIWMRKALARRAEALVKLYRSAGTVASQA